MLLKRLRGVPEIESGKLPCVLNGGENDKSDSRCRKVQRSAPDYSSLALDSVEKVHASCFRRSFKFKYYNSQ